MSTIEESFSKAVTRANELGQMPDNKTLLRLYSLFKQATQGDNTAERPKGFDFRAAAKYEAWESLKGMTKQEAMQQYVDLVESLADQN